MTDSLTRRNFLRGMIAAPAVLKLGLYMPVKSIVRPTMFIAHANGDWFTLYVDCRDLMPIALMIPLVTNKYVNVYESKDWIEIESETAA